MTAPNNNYVAGISDFDTTEYYQADAINPFNPVENDFAFGCLFWIRGRYQSLVSIVGLQRMFLFGNEDVANNTGWSLRLVRGTDLSIAGTADQLYLAAVMGNGSARVAASVRLGDGLSLAPARGQETPGYIDRLMHAIGWYDASANILYLSLNGNLVSAASVVFASSVAAPRLGLSPNGADFAENAMIAGAGFFNTTTPFTQYSVGDTASLAWQSARASLGLGYLTDLSSFDWTHRWEAKANAAGVVAPGLTKSADGAIIANYPQAPAVLEDVGSSGYTNKTFLAAPTPVALNRVGTNTTLAQDKNPVWHPGFSYGPILD